MVALIPYEVLVTSTPIILRADLPGWATWPIILVVLTLAFLPIIKALRSIFGGD